MENPKTLEQVRASLSVARRPVVLVPTMGALHRGHAALIEKARRVVGRDGTVVVSIFVNPTQFGEGEDFEAYPRDLATDLSVCEGASADIVWSPEPGDIYLPGSSTFVDETVLSRGLCGASRPGHFRGVCTVVAKLFHIISPDSAVFGKKDYQQLAVIRRMTADLCLLVEVIGSETIREPDGLALSSRNRYLSAGEREQAPAIFRHLTRVREAFDRGERDAKALTECFRSGLEADAPGATIDYVELVDAISLEPLEHLGDGGGVLAVAVFFGKARLIDNIELEVGRRAGE